MNDPMTPQFDRELALSILYGTYGLSQDALSLLRLMLRDANWNEGKLSGRFSDSGYLPAWFELSDCGLVSRKVKNCFLIHHKKLMPPPVQKETGYDH